MCDYCDCRSHPEIAALSADHEVLGRLLAALGQAAGRDDRDGAAAVAEELHHLLGHHAAREERGVFTQLERAGVGAGYVEGFETDHERIHALTAAVDGDGWQPAAAELIRSLADHIAREESDLFPAAHQLLTPAQWDAVEAAS